jgi:hypothetical protein
VIQKEQESVTCLLFLCAHLRGSVQTTYALPVPAATHTSEQHAGGDRPRYERSAIPES